MTDWSKPWQKTPNLRTWALIAMQKKVKGISMRRVVATPTRRSKGCTWCAYQDNWFGSGCVAKWYYITWINQIIDAFKDSPLEQLAESKSDSLPIAWLLQTWTLVSKAWSDTDIQPQFVHILSKGTSERLPPGNPPLTGECPTERKESADPTTPEISSKSKARKIQQVGATQ